MLPNLDEIIATEAWKHGHTPEDWEKLIFRRAIVGMKKGFAEMTRKQNEACARGEHGFHTVTSVSEGWIHTRCTNCHASWSTPDVPYC